MQEVNFDEALDQIVATDTRFQRDAYVFMREALDFTQKQIGKENQGKVRHVSGKELLDGLRQYALAQFGPMTITVFEEWGVHQC
ncbi:MAG TPA: Minf_1886 family protein, partial [bacterium]|nr:Minf_1886 family protein [bacterium]